MDGITMNKERRSVRKFKEQKVDRDLMKEIVDLCRYSPSWGNFQVVRFTLVDDKELIERLGKEAVNGFVYNIKTLKEARGVAVLSVVRGKSGKLDKKDFATSKAESWEVFDAGIACQTFCLAAHSKGIGTVIMGVIDDRVIADIVDLPEGETTAAIIVYGYPAETPPVPPRFPVEEILRFR